MCFSYAINFSPNSLKSKFGIENVSLPKQGFFFNGFEHPNLPVLFVPQNETNFKVDNFEWGLIPSWVSDSLKSKELQKNSLNARSETAFEKPMFQKAWEQNPCVILASGFFEWEHQNQLKIPHFIYPSSNEILYMAGIYDTWINSNTGNLIYSYSILTTHANQMMEKIHNVKKRMPVVLNEENAEKWLLLDAPSRQELCKPCPEEFLSSHTVSMKLNSPKNIRNEPWAIEPAIFAKQTTLF